MSTQNSQLLLTQHHEKLNLKLDQQQEKTIKDKYKQEGKGIDYAVGMGPFAQYFMKNIKKIQNLKTVQDKYGNSVNFKLISQISNGNILVNKHKRQFSIKSKIQSTYQKMQLEKQQLLKQKEYAKQKFNQLLKSQAQLLKKNASIIKNQSPRHTTNIHRKLFPEKGQEEELGNNKSCYQNYIGDNQQLKNALKRLKQFKKAIKKKQIQVELFAKHLKEEDLKQYMETIEEDRKKHKLQLQRRKQQVKKLKEDQQKYKRRSKEFVHQIKPEKYKFQIIKQMQEKQKVQKQRILISWRNKMGTNIFQEIKEHEQKYLSTINQRKQAWMNNFEENLKSYQRKKRYHSIFKQRIIQQSNKKSQQQQEKQDWKNQFLDRIKSYADHVSKNHKPIIEKSNQIGSQQVEKKLRHSFSRIQIRNKGLQYLKEVQQKIKQISPHSKNNIQENSLQLKGKSSSLPAIKQNTYKDYLRELPKRNKLSANPETFKVILNERKTGWAETALFMLNKLQSQPKASKKALESAYHKIQLLNAIL